MMPMSFRQSPQAPGSLGEDPDVEDLLSISKSRRLLCAVCSQPITDDEQRIAVGGRHVHCRTNPAGFDFEFGCFREAPGAIAVGASTAEHTWFPGFTWRATICRACGQHLGWLFDGSGAAFHGLILDRLEIEKPGRPGAAREDR